MVKTKSKSAFDMIYFLGSIFLFQNLAAEDLISIAKSAIIVRPKRKQFLFNEGDSADAFYIVVYGKMVIVKLSKNGGEHPLHYHEDRDLIAEAAIFDNEVYPATCMALKDSMLVKITRDNFISTIKKRPEVGIKMLAAYSKRLRGLVDMIEYLTLNEIKERLLKYLIKNCSSKVSKDLFDLYQLRKECRHYLIEVKLNKRELALILGAAPESLSRTLKVLKDEGALREIKTKTPQGKSEINFQRYILSLKDK